MHQVMCADTLAMQLSCPIKSLQATGRRNSRLKSLLNLQWCSEPANAELEATKIQLFQQFLLVQEVEGFEGTFPDFLSSIDASEVLQVGLPSGCAHVGQHIQNMAAAAGRLL